MGGRGTVCLSHVVLGDYIIHIFSDEIHIGRVCKVCSVPPASSGGRETVDLSDSVYIIHV